MAITLKGQSNLTWDIYKYIVTCDILIRVMKIANVILFHNLKVIASL